MEKIKMDDCILIGAKLMTQVFYKIEIISLEGSLSNSEEQRNDFIDWVKYKGASLGKGVHIENYYSDDEDEVIVKIKVDTHQV